MPDPTLPPSIHVLADHVARVGGRAYVVGGGVRDHLLGVPVKDWDVEVFGVSGADLAGLLRQLGTVNTVGRAFGVYKWRPHAEPESGEIDVSIPRRDSKVGAGHRGIAVEGDPDMPVDEAARRRDLTINAMMWDVAGRTLVDPSGGAADLAAGLLRAVDDTTFLEDPLRALRAVQFAARFGFEADPGLLELCRRAALDELPAERIQGEWGKLLLKAPRPSVGFALARAANVLERVFPEVSHVDTDRVLDALVTDRADLTEEGARWSLMLAGWLHAEPRASIEATLDRLWIHTVGGYPTRDRALALAETWTMPTTTDSQLRHASVAAPLRLTLPLQGAIDGVDRAAAWNRAAELGILDERPAPLLQGRHLKDLGVPPGPRMGDLLREIYTMQLDGTVTNIEEARQAAERLRSA